MKNLILASSSPRRKALFSLFGFPFIVNPAEIDENQRPGESPPDYVLRLAREKALKVAGEATGLVMAADTTVADGDEILGKPQDAMDAKRMLQQLRGRIHQVYTGIALIDTKTGDSYEDLCRTDVPMRNYSDEEIEAYIATGDPMDKAGAYAIQHPGFHPVEDLEGCFTSVMGLPICRLIPGLRRFGLEIPPDMPERCEAALDYRCPTLSKVIGQA
jgi:septum formation protein